MTAITSDTFKFVERLEKAGIPREQASAIVEAQQQSFSDAQDATFATKSDMRELKSDISRLENRIDKLESRMESNMGKMELRLTIKLGAFIAAAVGILIAVLRVAH